MAILFPGNPQREDPYRNFKFRVKWGTEYVAFLSKMSAIKRTTEVVEWREAGGGGVNRSAIRKLPGRSKMEPVTLEQGLSHDSEFITWAEQVNNPIGDGNGALLWGLARQLPQGRDHRGLEPAGRSRAALHLEAGMAE